MPGSNSGCLELIVQKARNVQSWLNILVQFTLLCALSAPVYCTDAAVDPVVVSNVQEVAHHQNPIL